MKLLSNIIARIAKGTVLLINIFAYSKLLEILFLNLIKAYLWFFNFVLNMGKKDELIRSLV